MKFIDFSELSSHFLPEQLPLSLGGTFVPRIASPVHFHSPMGVTKDDSAVIPPRSPPDVRRGSDGSKTKRESQSRPHPPPGGGKSVNKMLGLFEGGHGSRSSSNKPLPPPSPSRVRPIPPAKPTAPKKGPTQPSVQPLVKLQLHEAGDVGSKSKVPLLPPNGRAALTSSGKPTSMDGPPSSSRQAVRAAVKPALMDSTLGSKPVGKAAGKPALMDSTSGSKPVGKADGLFSKFGGGEVKKRVQKIASNGESPSRDKQSGNASDNFTTSCSVKKSKPAEGVERRRADSADRATPSKGHGQSGPSQSPHIPPLHPLPYTAGNKKGASESLPTKTKLLMKSVSTEYENVSAPKTKTESQSKPPPQPPPQPHPESQPHPQPLSQESLDYEILAFTNRDSDVYENIGIGFAGTGDQVTGPLPPLPLHRQPAQPVRQSYENVALGKSPVKGRRKEQRKEVVEEEEDTLFGKEGPPGMQETIYENFGPDRGNRLMTIEELAAHVEKLGKKGLSTEYYRVRNEPITGAHKACR